MDEISKLLQEAKPLYLKRKKTREVTRKCLLAIMPVIVCISLVLPFTIGEYTSQISYNSSTSVVEQMGLPTDEYGLLKVD